MSLLLLKILFISYFIAAPAHQHATCVGVIRLCFSSISVAANLITLRYMKDSDYLTPERLEKTMSGVSVVQMRLMSMYNLDRENDVGYFRHVCD